MFYAEEKAALRNAMARQGLREVRFRFDFEGTKIVFSGDGGLRAGLRIAA
jgi:D-glycero-alpha-D-manno-heptose-7-phosphate kinase